MGQSLSTLPFDKSKFVDGDVLGEFPNQKTFLFSVLSDIIRKGFGALGVGRVEVQLALGFEKE
jgi:hypothetical protein